MNPHETLSVVRAVKHVFHAERLLFRSFEYRVSAAVAVACMEAALRAEGEGGGQ